MRRSKGLLDQIANANEEANPELFRLAMKMATGSGKTTVMAMLIAWQAVNAARKESKDFSRAFLIVTPGITIKDRLRVLQPSEPDNYYETREIVPPEMLPDIRRAEIVITNYHAFQHRETLALPKVARSFLQGNDPEPLKTTETDAEMLERACGKLLRYDRVNVINDEAHHCYRHKVGADAEGALTGDDKKEAAENEEAARLWINGIEALDRKLSKGVRAVYDLSATPFFLRGSGYQEGTLFPWVVSDFSLMDAIESGIVKLPRVPVTDNLVQTDTVVYRDLWKHIGKDLPKTAAGAAKLSPFDLPNTLKTALNALYSHYEGEFERWQRAGIGVPPVFIVVCQNTAISKLVFEWIAGFERGDAEEGERAAFHAGHLELFRNYDEQGARLASSAHAADRLPPDRSRRRARQGFPRRRRSRDRAVQARAGGPRRRRRRAGRGQRERAAARGDEHRRPPRSPRRADPLRRLGFHADRRLGHQHRHPHPRRPRVRHPASVRAGGRPRPAPPILRAEPGDRPVRRRIRRHHGHPVRLRRLAAESPSRPSRSRSRASTRSRSAAALEIVFPRVSGYRRDLPSEKLEAVFTEDSRLEITPADIGPTSVVDGGDRRRRRHDHAPGAGAAAARRRSASTSPSTFSTPSFRDEDGFPKQHLFPQIQRLARRWLDEGYLVTKGVPIGAILYQDQLARAAEKIDIACTRAGEGHIVAVLDPYNPKGSTRHVNFITSKPCWTTGAQPPKSHISHVVLDSELGGAARPDARGPSARARLRQEPGAGLRDPLSR